MKSLDTNLLLRLVLDDIPEQRMAVEALLMDASQQYMVADMVFAEIAWVLQRAFGQSREHIAANLRVILGIPQINCNRVLLERVLPMFVKHSGISFIGACLAVYAELNGATPLLTFDEKLAKTLPGATVAL